MHEVAAQVAPDTRVGYIDNDPIVHAHANALLTGSATSTVLADLREPQASWPTRRSARSSTSPGPLRYCWWRHFIAEQENLARIPGRLPRGAARGQLPGPRLRRPPCYAGRRNRTRPAAVSRAPAAIITSHGAGFAGGCGAVPPNPAEAAPFGMI